MDWNATAPLLDAARAACLAAFDLSGNPSSVHQEGRAARTLVESARRDVAGFVGADLASVTFTSGATEAANLVLAPNFRMGRTPLRISRLYVSAIEHPAVRDGGRFTREAVTEIPVTAAGVVSLDQLESLLSAHDKADGLAMVALMAANNETGILQPVAAAGEIVRRHGGILVADAVQAAGRIPLSLDALCADFLILSSHKLGGPKGAGALVSRGEVMMPEPLLRGGGQEKGHRSGTENVAAIAGFAAAVREAADGMATRMERIGALRSLLEDRMRQAAPDVIIHGADGPRIGNTSFFTLPGLKSETGQIAFDLEGVALSAGSACSSGKVGQSHVLTAMGFDADQGGLRISIGASTSEADIGRCAEVFAKVAGRRVRAGVAA